MDAFTKDGCNKYSDLFPGVSLGGLEDAVICRCTGDLCNDKSSISSSSFGTTSSSSFGTTSSSSFGTTSSSSFGRYGRRNTVLPWGLLLVSIGCVLPLFASI